MTESVLRWRLLSAPEMAVQLDKLVTLSRLPNVWVGVVPLSAPMTEVPTCSFAVFDARLATVEIPHAEISTAEPRDVEVYSAKFERFEAVAITGDSMQTALATIRDDFLRERGTP